MALAIRERITGARGCWRDDFEQQLRAARRTVKDIRHRSEDALADATHQIRRHPLQAVGGAAAAGAVFGSMFGLAAGLVAMRLRRRS